jgi:hypothetical protein
MKCFSADMSNKRNLLMIPSFNRIIRFFLYVQIPTEAGNDMVKDPSLLRNIEEYINYVKAEGAYCGPSNGSRTMFFCCKYGFCRHDFPDN